MKKVIVVDIDGTIAKVGDRLKYLQQELKNWDAFYEHCDEDEPIGDIVRLVENFWECGYDIVFCTGRKTSVRGKTIKWIHQHLDIGVNYDLLMRKDNDWRPDTEVKPEMLTNAGYSPENVWLILEDRDSVVAKLRQLGYTCIQVADGKF